MVQAASYNPESVNLEDIIKFIEGASYQECDFEADRWYSVFQFLREKYWQKVWYLEPDIRDFLVENINKNPYIPVKYVLLNEKANSKKPSPQKSFVSKWKKHFGITSLETFGIPIDDFADKLQRSEIFAERTTLIRTHNLRTFFNKFAEYYISYTFCKRHSYKKIVDIGANQDTFVRFITEFIDDLEFKLIDYAFPKGETRVNDQITKIGTDAGDLSCIEDESTDVVCMHNAFEHFIGDSDSRCIKECRRILKPGGRIIIAPANVANNYSLKINPITFFYTRPDKFMLDALENEISSDTDNSFFFHFGMYGHFARGYNWANFLKRVLDPAGDMDCQLCPVDFKGISDNESQVYHQAINGHSLRYDNFKERGFKLLVFTK